MSLYLFVFISRKADISGEGKYIVHSSSFQLSDISLHCKVVALMPGSFQFFINDCRFALEDYIYMYMIPFESLLHVGYFLIQTTLSLFSIFKIE